MHVVGNSICRSCGSVRSCTIISLLLVLFILFIFFTFYCNYNLIFPGPFLGTWIVGVWLQKIRALELVLEARNLMEILKIANSRNLIVMELDFKPKFNYVQTNAIFLDNGVLYFRSFYWIELF